EAVDAELLRGPKRLDDLPRGEHARADIAHLAGADQVVERTQRLVDRDIGHRAVKLIEIDPIGLEPFEGRLARLDDVPAAQAARARIVRGHRSANLPRPPNRYSRYR